MGKTKIKTDSHGLYARGCGYIWRPVWPVGYKHVHNGTVFSDGMEVTVSHSGGPLCSIKCGDVKERWYSHGSYMVFDPEPRTVPSEELFKPDYNTW